MAKYTNLDANETIFFSQELEHVKARTYDVKYPELLFDKVFPISSEVPAAAETFTYMQYDMVGHAKLIHNYANDLPVVGATGKKFTHDVYSLGVSFGYSMQDIRAAAMAGKSLDQRLANAARKAVLTKMNDLAFYGDGDTNMPPFISNPNINAYTVPADGTGSSKAWADKTPDQILRDINDAAQAVRTITKSVEQVNTLLVPDAQYGHLATTPRSSTSDTTILDFLLRTSPWIDTVVPCYELAGAGPAGVDCFILYNKSPEKLAFEVPLQYEMFAAQQQGLYYEVPAHARVGGIVLYCPKSIIQGDGI